jgi:hypothetical protein
MRHQRRCDAVGDQLLGGLAEGQRLGLGEEVGHQQVVVSPDLGRRVDDADEVGRDQRGPLVDELEVGVLAVGARRPHTTGPVGTSTGDPPSVTDLPLLSTSSCCR